MRPFFALLMALSSVTTTVRAGDIQEAHIEAVIPRFGHFLGAGFGSIWVMSGDKLARIRLADNSVTDIPIEGAGSIGGLLDGTGLAVGEGAVWVPDVNRQVIYKVDPHTHQVVTRAALGMAGGSGGSIGVGEGALWVISGAGKNEMKRYSAETGTEEARYCIRKFRLARCIRFRLDHGHRKRRTLSG